MTGLVCYEAALMLGRMQDLRSDICNKSSSSTHLAAGREVRAGVPGEARDPGEGEGRDPGGAAGSAVGEPVLV